jgi:hypothetical protein
MRLPLEQRLRPLQKLFLPFARWLFEITPGPVLLVSYRKSYFGKLWAPCMNQGMRRAKHWTFGELELFAAFVSNLNSCGY